MMGLSMGMALGSRSRVAAAVSRLWNDSADKLWIVTPSPWGTALAYRFNRNVGGSGGTDLGSPWEPFRRTGVFEVATVEEMPNELSTAFIYGNDTGSFDYAMQLGAGAFAFGGSYHGGETVVSETWRADGSVIDPAEDAEGNTFRLTRETLVDYGSGNTMTVNYDLTIGPSGVLTEAVSFTSAAPFASGQFPGMEIAESVFTRAIVGETTTNLVSGKNTLSGGDVTLRSPFTGHTIRVVSDAAAHPAYAETYVQVAGRSKLYFRLNSTAGAALGTRASSRTITFGKGEADPVFDGGLVSNGGFEAGLSSWNAPNGWTAPDGVAVGSSVPAFNSLTQTLASPQTGAGNYTLSFDITVSAGAMRPRLRNSGAITGSIAAVSTSGSYSATFTGATDVAQVQFQAESAGFTGTIDNVRLVRA